MKKLSVFALSAAMALAATSVMTPAAAKGKKAKVESGCTMSKASTDRTGPYFTDKSGKRCNPK